MKKGGVLNLLEKIKSIDVHDVSITALRDTAPAIAELNREQLFDGLDRQGHDIEPEYTPLTVEIKESKGQITDRVILRDEGNFWREIKTDVTDKKVITQSTDEKAPELREKYGNGIEGIGTGYKRDYIQKNLRPRYLQIMKQKTGL